MPKSETRISVYDNLRTDILNLTLKPGEELDINAVAEKMGVSRSPVRDALLRLSSDRLVDIFPQKGTRVSLLNKDIIRQERFMRINLELGVLRECVKTLSEQSKREIFATRLKGILIAQHAALLDGDNKNFLRLDDKLHHQFYSQADCEWVWETQLSHTGNDHRIRILSYNTKSLPEKAETEHNLLLEAILENDIEKAVNLDTEHLSRLYKEIDNLEKDFPNYFE